LADECIYIQWNPGKCTNIACLTVPAVRHWSDPWYLSKKPHMEWERLSMSKSTSFLCVCMFQLKTTKHGHNRASFLFLRWN
jgi:hypothetical protein